MPQNYAQRVGERLRSVRKQKRLSLQAVEASSRQEFKASVLGAYERGERAISVPRLQRLARFYSVPVDQLLPRDLGLDPAWGGGAPEEEIDLTTAEQAERRLGAKRVASLTVNPTDLEPRSGTPPDLLGRHLRKCHGRRPRFSGPVECLRQKVPR